MKQISFHKPWFDAIESIKDPTIRLEVFETIFRHAYEQNYNQEDLVEEVSESTRLLYAAIMPYIREEIERYLSRGFRNE